MRRITLTFWLERCHIPYNLFLLNGSILHEVLAIFSKYIPNLSTKLKRNNRTYILFLLRKFRKRMQFKMDSQYRYYRLAERT